MKLVDMIRVICGEEEAKIFEKGNKDLNCLDACKRIGKYRFNILKDGSVTIFPYGCEIMQAKFVKEMNEKFGNQISDKVMYVHDGPFFDVDDTTTELESFGPNAIFLVDKMILHSIEQLQFAVQFAKDS